MSCRGAAGRFGVAPSTAIDLVSEWRSTGACEAGAQGGDRRSARIEGHAAEILSLVKATPDTTLAEIADHLFKVHGERFVPSVLWRFSASDRVSVPDRRSFEVRLPSPDRFSSLPIVVSVGLQRIMLDRPRLSHDSHPWGLAKEARHLRRAPSLGRNAVRDGDKNIA